MTEDKIFDEFNQLIKDLTDDLIRDTDDPYSDTDDPYSDSVDTALTKVISARRSYKWKKANDQRIADFKKQNPNEDPGNAKVEISSEY
ncbi:hypothetical protein HMPREF3209_00907 [Lactobacillus crispatus]|uniref:hypothetical protein n=1 Tax=Lactobacillus crispatus TaxID=47770 RepID=UPI00076FD99B|nr:hypothetical protein [Lactobacillus crispatus]KXI20062.1 hypothetical protein HMPREF3209_00907 [Lactobacillus crispatus]